MHAVLYTTYRDPTWKSGLSAAKEDVVVVHSSAAARLACNHRRYVGRKLDFLGGFGFI
jgi:hypothetical protein